MQSTVPTLSEIILDLIPNRFEKKLLEIGSHDDSLTKELAQEFQHISLYYEFLKNKDYTEENIDIKKIPHIEILKRMKGYDVIVLVNEFHHLPDILQMQTYDTLLSGQDLILIEWDFTGNIEYFYKCFQNCAPLCMLTREILTNFTAKGVIDITSVTKTRSEEGVYKSSKDLREFFKFMLPDHWKFGKDELDIKLKHTKFPIHLWEGFDVFLINKK